MDDPAVPRADEAPAQPQGLQLWLIRLGLLFFGALVVLTVGEIAIRVVAPQDLRVNCRVLGPRGYFYNQTGGTARHEFNGRVVTYRFNEQRLRGGPLGEGSPRILVLGDSFTFGYLVDEEYAYAGRLQTYSDEALGPGAVEFLNGGTEGWGSADSLAFLEDFGESLAPEVVLVFYNFDDIRRATRSGLYVLRDPETLELEARSRPVDFRSGLKRTLENFPLYAWSLERLHLVRLLRNMAARVRLFQDKQTLLEPGQDADAEAAAERYDRDAVLLGRAIFRRFQRWCDAHGARLLVVTTGFQPRHCHQEAYRPANLAFWLQAEEFFAQEGIPYKDISPEVEAIVQGRWEEYIIPHDHHPNEAGTELTARQVWNWLDDRLRATVTHSGQ